MKVVQQKSGVHVLVLTFSSGLSGAQSPPVLFTLSVFVPFSDQTTFYIFCFLLISCQQFPELVSYSKLWNKINESID